MIPLGLEGPQTCCVLASVHGISPRRVLQTPAFLGNAAFRKVGSLDTHPGPARVERTLSQLHNETSEECAPLTLARS